MYIHLFDVTKNNLRQAVSASNEIRPIYHPADFWRVYIAIYFKWGIYVFSSFNRPCLDILTCTVKSCAVEQNNFESNPYT